MTKIEQIQKISCLLLDEFIKVCRDHNLQWFIDAGSLLGVIRHGGFIPWDDDIDIVMPRKDYNILYENKDLFFTGKFYLQVGQNCSGDTLTMRLKDSESTMIYHKHLSSLFRDADGRFFVNCGISIDIEPIDHVPDGDEKRNLLLSFVDSLYSNCDIVEKDCGNSHQRIMIMSRYDRSSLLYNNVMTYIDGQGSSLMACTPWWIFDNSRGYTVSADCYSGFIEMPFMGCKENVRVPVGYDEILRAYYGNYMVEKKRNTEKIYENVLVDADHSYHDYERFSNEELLKMIENNETL